MTCRIELPWPPSMNSYWRSVAGRVLISKAGRIYREAVVAQAARESWPAFDGAVRVTLQAAPPDARRRDLDNMLKPMLDALTHAHLWADDSQVDDPRITRELPRRPAGLMVINVEALEAL